MYVNNLRERRRHKVSQKSTLQWEKLSLGDLDIQGILDKKKDGEGEKAGFAAVCIVK